MQEKFHVSLKKNAVSQRVKKMGNSFCCISVFRVGQVTIPYRSKDLVEKKASIFLKTYRNYTYEYDVRLYS